MQTFNISHTYVDKNDPWTGILAAAEFAIISTTNRLKCYSPGQLLFDCDMILPIKNKVGCGLICQKNKAKINKDNIRKNRHRVYYNYKVRDYVMLTNHTV